MIGARSGEASPFATPSNPFEIARDLEAAGVERRQAETHAEALHKAATADRDELATKTDLAAVKADIAALQSDLAAVEISVASLKSDPGAVKWILAVQSDFILAMAAKMFELFCGVSHSMLRTKRKRRAANGGPEILSRATSNDAGPLGRPRYGPCQEASLAWREAQAYLPAGRSAPMNRSV